VTDCPAYLSLTLNDRTAGEEMSRYDALISCPPRFNLSVHVPAPASPSRQRLYEVILHDSKVEQRVFLSTHIVPDDAVAAAERRCSDARRVDDDDDNVKYGGGKTAACI